MTHQRLYLLMGLIFFHLVLNPSFATAASTDGIHTLKSSTFGSSAARVSSATYQVIGIVGQAVSGQHYQADSYMCDAGFWQGFLLPVLAGDLNDDGRINLEDMVGGLRNLTEQGAEATFTADVDGDGKLTAAELIHIMRKQAKLVQ